MLRSKAFRPKVQKDIQRVVFNALAYRPQERYENVKLFAEELEKACFGCIREKRPPRAHLQNLYQEIADCDEIIRLNPHNTKAKADAHFKKGLAFYNLKRDAEAVASFEEATRLNSRNAFAHHHKGLALYRLNRYEEALAAYNEAL